MTQRTLPAEVRLLIQGSVPTLEALDLLVLLVREAPRPWSLPELLERLRPSGVREAQIREYLATFRSQGLLADDSSEAYLYRPASDPVARAVAALITAYNERPVTLIRTVYEIADARRIQAFADAFKIKKDE